MFRPNKLPMSYSTSLGSLSTLQSNAFVDKIPKNMIDLPDSSSNVKLLQNLSVNQTNNEGQICDITMANPISKLKYCKLEKTIYGKQLSRTKTQGLQCKFQYRSYSIHHHTPDEVSTPYEVLGIKPDCSKNQVKDAFYRLSKVYHPDVNKSEDAKQKYLRISNAYEILSNDKLRKQYDGSGTKAGGGSFHGPEFSDRRTRFGQKKYQPKNVMPPMGRSEHYNYDDWYKKHYAEHFEKSKVDRIRKNNFDRAKKIEERANQYENDRAAERKLYIPVAICLLVIYYVHYKANKQLPEKKKS